MYYLFNVNFLKQKYLYSLINLRIIINNEIIYIRIKLTNKFIFRFRINKYKTKLKIKELIICLMLNFRIINIFIY